MTVNELLKVLKRLPPTLEVVMSKDGEGNQFSPYDEYSLGIYTPESTWSGSFESHVQDDNGYSIKVEEPNAIVFWPMN